MNAIEMTGLTKKYGERAAVKSLNLSIEQGTCFALLGVNGAGKTTTIKMLSCLTKPTIRRTDSGKIIEPFDRAGHMLCSARCQRGGQNNNDQNAVLPDKAH